MKNAYYLLFLAAILFISCSSSEDKTKEKLDVQFYPYSLTQQELSKLETDLSKVNLKRLTYKEFEEGLEGYYQVKKAGRFVMRATPSKQKKIKSTLEKYYIHKITWEDL